MINPLAENCLQFRQDSRGMVTGVALGITFVSNSNYAVYSVRLRDEYEAQGTTVAKCQVIDKNGITTGQAVRMAWPGRGPSFDASALPGNPNNEHPVVNGYNPPNDGPLAFYVGNHNHPQSDIVYGVGLPYNRHVSFDIIFRERGAVIDPPVDPPVDGDWALRVAALEHDLEKLRQMLTAQISVTQTWIGD